MADDQKEAGSRGPEPVREAAFRIARAALTARDMRQLYTSLHGIIRELMPADNFYIALHDAATGIVSFPYWVDQMEAFQPDRPFGRGLTEYVLRTGEPQLVDEGHLRELQARGEVGGIGPESLAWLGVPLLGAEGPFGAVVVQSYAGGYPYGEDEKALLAFVSDQMAMAIERLRAETVSRLTRLVLDQTMDDVFGMVESGRFVFVNRSACEHLGYTQEELLGLGVLDLNPTLTPETWAANWAEVRRGESPRLEAIQKRKDGSIRPVEIARSLFTFEGREFLFSTVRDISERKAADEALRRSEARFLRAFHASPDAIIVTRLSDGAILDVNEGFTRLSGWTPGEAVGRTTLDLAIWVNPEDRQRMQELVRTQGRYSDIEAPFRTRDGRILTGLQSGLVLEMDGEPTLLTYTRDITAQKQIQTALRASERRLWTVLKHAQAIVFQLDPEGRFLLSEGLGLQALGLQPGQVVGQSALELYREEEPLVAQLRRALEGHGSRTLTRAGERVFDNTLTPVFDDAGHLESVIGIALDVTDAQAAQAALLAERGLFVGGPVMVVRWRPQPGWPVDYVSPNIQEILGYDPEDLISGRFTFDALVHPDDLERIHSEAYQNRRGGTTHYEQEYRLRHANGDYRWFYDFTGAAEARPDPSYLLGYLLDITDRRQAEEALRQAQKMESLGVLAGGIAHDFNNLLTSILGNLNLAQLQLPPGTAAQTYLENMEKGILRAAELAKQMLAYSGRGRFVVAPQDLNAVVREMAHLLEVSIPKKVALHFDLDAELPVFEADSAQIQQVVMNLVTNAADAIGDHDGRIRIHTGCIGLGEDELPALPGQTLAPGPYVMLEVEDTGCGMAPEVLARIFDPFYTTKATGRGLGLSAMLGILRGHHAGLRIRSRPGEGSVFQLFFPVAEATSPAPAHAPAPPGMRLRGRVLLVDDEAMVRETTGGVLAALGFEVVQAQDGLEAVALVDQDPDGFDLVFMDLTMPRMDGREAFQAMRARKPALKVILCSGYTEQDILRTFQGEAPAAFIQKPFQFQELRRVISSVMGAP
jgi:PAS domain S-box-containing protein